MTTGNAPRYLPTLTEVVSPDILEPQNTLHSDASASITDHVLTKISPLVEQQLRSAAQELFEVQLNVVLPSLHRQIELAVREAVKEALAQRGFPD